MKDCIKDSLGSCVRELLYHKVAYAIVSQEGFFVEMSGKYAELAGYHAEELLGKPLTQIDSKLHSDDFYAEIALSLQNKGEWVGIVCNKMKTGRHYWVESKLSLIPNGHGTLIICNEVTELQSQLFAYQSILNCTAHSILTFDSHGRITSSNPGAQQLFGYKEHEFKGALIHEILFDESELTHYANEQTDMLGRYVAPGFEALVARCLDWSAADTRDWILRCSTGMTLQVECSISPLFNEVGALSGFVFIGYDVTIARALEKQRRDQDIQLRRITEQLPGAVFDMVAEGDSYRMGFVSASLYGLFGLPVPTEPQRDVPMGEFMSRIHPDDIPAVMSSLQESRASIGDWFCEFRVILDSGANRWLRSSASPEIRESGHIFWCGYVSDHTDHKAAEVELMHASHHDPLTDLYNRRHADLVMDQIEQSQRFPVGIFAMDLNGLKAVNDDMGHEAGDRYLVRTARCLQRTFRESDMVARMGGDEYLVLMPGAGEDAVNMALQRLEGMIAEFNKVPNEIPLSLAIGTTVALRSGELADKLREADQVMYANKKARRKSISS